MSTLLRIAMLAALSGLCFWATLLCTGSGSGFLYLGWFSALLVAGFVSGVVWPQSAFWGAVLIAWAQSPFYYLQLTAVGEIQNPSRSTGGAVDWAIVTIILVGFSPIPGVASLLGARLRRRSTAAQPHSSELRGKPRTSHAPRQ